VTYSVNLLTKQSTFYIAKWNLLAAMQSSCKLIYVGILVACIGVFTIGQLGPWPPI